MNSVLFHLLSIIPVVLSVCLFFAPLPTLYSIYQCRHTMSFPLIPYASMMASGTLWTIYGILSKDLSISISNGSGSLLGFIYCIIFVCYSIKPLANSIKIQMTLAISIIIFSVFLAIFAKNSMAIAIIGPVGDVMAVA